MKKCNMDFIPDAIFVVSFWIKSSLELWQLVMTSELPGVISHHGHPPEPLPPGPGQLGDDGSHGYCYQVVNKICGASVVILRTGQRNKG